MSGGLGCTCPGTAEEKRKHWRVEVRNANHSAFSGYRRTPSRYSRIRCLQCGHVWRTKAKYVAELPDYKLCGTKP